MALALLGVAVPPSSLSVALRAQQQSVPSARLTTAPTTILPAEADSNSPAIWEQVRGRLQLFVLTSVAGQPSRHVGAQSTRLRTLGEVRFVNHPGDGVWFEAVLPDVDGTWYGFYHNEIPAAICGDPGRVIPRIGMARSSDFGATWQNLGPIVEAPLESHTCASTNQYFVGGVGDFSVVLDHDWQYAYVFFSSYTRDRAFQGVSVARLAWADRDAPAGRATIWSGREAWLSARVVPRGDASGHDDGPGGDDGDEGNGGSQDDEEEDSVRYDYPAGTPIYRASDGWHDGSTANVFWGPSVHWNTYLERYVMLLNRAKDTRWSQEGVYVAFAPALEDPSAWSAPQRLLTGGRWYPQVLGMETGTGTDRLAGQRARLYLNGRSDHTIEFTK